MYSAILISLYTLFKYAWVIKQFLLESGKKSIKKKEPKAKWTHWVLSGWIINCQLYFARSPPPLKLLQNDLANSQGIHVSILNNLYSSCKMIQLNDPYIMKSKYWKCNCDCNWELSWKLYILGHHPPGCYRVLLLINSDGWNSE